MSPLIDFVLPALFVSGSALAALRLAPTAPPGLRFALSLTGLLAWFVPWPSISFSLTASVAPGVAWLGEGSTELAAIRQILVATADAAVPAMPPPSPAWLLVFVPGFVWFAADLSAYGATLRRWRNVSRTGRELGRFLPPGFAGSRIRVVPDSSIVVAAGLLRPTIFIGDRIVDEDALRAALTHEACHARRRDPLWLMLVTLTARLYCFNPIVLALKRQAILAIEAGCDEACARRLGRPQYRRTLARLILEREGQRSLTLAPSLHTPGLNFMRLTLLGRGSRVDGRALSAALLVLAAGIGGVSWGSAGSMRPWLGDWIEIANLSHWGYDVAPPISRRFERAGGGLTRIYAPDGALGEWADFRCDGRGYPALDAAGESSLTLACAAIDPWTHRYVVERADGSGIVADMTETMSHDGETMGLTIRHVAAGRTTEMTRTLSRLR